ncbi:hypothetical protein D3C81_1794350 [compost metagenome]
MGGEHHGPRMLCKILQETVIEQVPRYRVQSQIRLVKDCQRCTAGQPDYNAYCGEHTAGKLLDPAVQRELKVLHQGIGILSIPIRIEQSRHIQHILDLVDIGIFLAFLDK